MYSPTEMCREVPRKKYMMTGKKAAYSPYQVGMDASKLKASPEGKISIITNQPLIASLNNLHTVYVLKMYIFYIYLSVNFLILNASFAQYVLHFWAIFWWHVYHFTNSSQINALFTYSDTFRHTSCLIKNCVDTHISHRTQFIEINYSVAFSYFI